MKQLLIVLVAILAAAGVIVLTVKIYRARVHHIQDVQMEEDEANQQLSDQKQQEEINAAKGRDIDTPSAQ